MTDTPGPRIMYLEGSQEVLGGASERCPVPPAGSQEALRKRTVRAVLSGMKQTAAAGTFGVARGTVARWMHQYRQGGEAVLAQRPQGRPPAPKLTGAQEAAVVALIETYSPDQLGLPTSLWTRETVG